MVERHDADGDGEQDDGEQGVGEKPEGLAAEVAERFVLRDVSFDGHGF